MDLLRGVADGARSLAHHPPAGKFHDPQLTAARTISKRMKRDRHRVALFDGLPRPSGAEAVRFIQRLTYCIHYIFYIRHHSFPQIFPQMVRRFLGPSLHPLAPI